MKRILVRSASMVQTLIDLQVERDCKSGAVECDQIAYFLMLSISRDFVGMVEIELVSNLARAQTVQLLGSHQKRQIRSSLYHLNRFCS